MVGFDFVERQMTNGLEQLFEMNALGDERARFFAGGGQPLLVGLCDVIGKFRAPADVAQPVFAPLDEQLSEFLLSGGGSGGQRHPF
jgi:hypothetical protein